MRLLLTLLLILPLVSKSQNSTWKTVVNDSDSSQYIIPSNNIPNAWIQASFNASGWLNGKGGFGFGDSDDSTLVFASPSIFIRHKFQIENTNNLKNVLLHIDYDDGFVAYLNGKEIVRKNMSTIVHPNYAELATESHEALLKGNGIPEAFILDKDLLANDSNIFCIQVHNQTHTSQDVTARFWISVEEIDSSIFYHTTPSWMEPEFDTFKSNYPIVLINTQGNKIQDAYRINGRMQIINNGNSNSKYDSPTDYNGNINIEIRGTSSSNYAKKQYALETQNEWGGNNNVSIFGWPKENDWILYAPYSDKALLRNILAYKISSEMGHYAPRTRLCEVFINNQYQGVYVFTEKIKQDEGRVNISKLKQTDLSGKQLTGGYILQVDRNDPSNYSWQSPYAPYGGGNDINLVCEYPKLDNIQLQQINYITDWITQFEDNLAGPSYDELTTGYRNFIDVKSFIDFFLVQEISKNVDGYRLSSYLHKNRSDKDSLIHAGPVWDFNLGFGNSDYCKGGNYEGWAYNFNDYCSNHFNQVPFWWSRLLEDENYQNEIKCRWNELRATTLRTSILNKWIDEQVSNLHEAQKRNFQAWDILSTYITPNNYIGNTYDNEIIYFRNWLNNRLAWMDENMFGTCDIPISGQKPGAISLLAYPNSFQQKLTLRVTSNSNTKISMRIFDQIGKIIYQKDLGKQDIGPHEFVFTNEVSQLAQGAYFIQISNTEGIQKTLRVLKQ